MNLLTVFQRFPDQDACIRAPWTHSLRRWAILPVMRKLACSSQGGWRPHWPLELPCLLL